MTDELNITVCGECTRPLVIEDGAARELTDGEARSIAGGFQRNSVEMRRVRA